MLPSGNDAAVTLAENFQELIISQRIKVGLKNAERHFQIRSSKFQPTD